VSEDAVTESPNLGAKSVQVYQSYAAKFSQGNDTICERMFWTRLDEAIVS